MGVLARCENGDDIAHEWSAKDERYDPQETQDKLDRARTETTGASLCSRFAGLSTKCKAVREACPHFGKINSPISLGSPSPEQLAQEEDAKKKAALLADALVAVEELKEEIADQLDNEGEVKVEGDKSASKDKEYQKHLVVLRRLDARAFEQLRIWLKKNGCRMARFDEDLDTVEKAEFAWLTKDRSNSGADEKDEEDEEEAAEGDSGDVNTPEGRGPFYVSWGKFRMTHKGLRFSKEDKTVREKLTKHSRLA